MTSLPKVRFHDLRHTAASLMLNNGATPLLVANQLGHSKVSMTMNRYAHLLPSHNREGVEAMDRIMAFEGLPTVPELYRNDQQK